MRLIRSTAVVALCLASCGCRHELPALAKLDEKYRSRGFTVVGLSVDRDRETEQIAAFVRRRKLPFLNWHDPEDRASQTLQVKTLPASFLVGRDGTILWRRDGMIEATDESLKTALEAALAKPKL